MDQNTRAAIKKKQAMLDIARATASKLEREIAALEAEPDEFEKWLETRVDERQPASAEPSQSNIPLVVKTKAATPSGRNRKGSVAMAIADALGDGEEHDISAILDRANGLLANKLNRNSLRTQLMYLRQKGKVVSVVDGIYRKP